FGRDQMTEVVDEQTALHVRLVPPRIEPRRRHALEDPELQEDLLEVRIGGIERFRATDRELAGLDLLHVRLGRSHVPPADVVPVPVGAGAQADVRPTLPITEVVYALEARTGPVRDLIVAVAGVAEHLARQQEHVGLQIRIGSVTSPAATSRPSAVAGSIVSAYAETCSGPSARV